MDGPIHTGCAHHQSIQPEYPGSLSKNPAANIISGSPNLSRTARTLIEDAANQPFLSVASLWEMAIKLSLGKLSLGEPFEVLIPQQMKVNGINLLGIEIEHTALVARLPFHHRDPFDRLLVAQAVVERMPIVSADAAFDAYEVERLW